MKKQIKKTAQVELKITREVGGGTIFRTVTVPLQDSDTKTGNAAQMKWLREYIERECGAVELKNITDAKSKAKVKIKVVSISHRNN